MNLPEFSVRRFVTVIMIFLGILVLGLVSLVSLPTDLLPEIEIPAISIITIYPGAAAEDVESKVTKKIEDVISTVNNLDELKSMSRENMSVVTALFDFETNLDEASNDIRDLLELAKRELPDNADDPILFKLNTSMFPILVFGITADENYGGLYHLIDDRIADPLKRVPGVGAVQFLGGMERQIRVEFDPAKIEAYDLDLSTILSTIVSENLDMPVGSIKMNQTEYIVRVPGEFTNPTQIEQVVVGVHAGRPIHLKDVATVEDAFKEKTLDIRSNGKNGLILLVQKQSGANNVEVASLVRDEVKRLSSRLPDDVVISEIFDASVFTKRSLNNMTEAVVVGGIIVILVILGFLRHIRASLIIALTIPFSLIIAFFFFFLFEYTINMVSLMSLAIAVGIVVDNAIVVLENITRHIEAGSRPTEASVYGTSEVGMAVVASTLTIVAVFAPMLFAGGLVGIMFQQLAAAVIITVLASLFASLTLTPALASRLMHKTNNAFRNISLLKRAHNTSERWFNAVEGKYAMLLSWALRNKKKTLLVTAIVFLGTGGLVPFLSTEFIPQGDTGDVVVEFEMAPGTRMETVAVVALELEQVLRDSIPEAKDVFTRVGQSSQAFSVAIGQAGETHKGQVGAKLVEQKLRDRSSREVANIIREYANTIPGILKLDIKAGNPIADILFGGDKPITIEIIGHDIEQTNALAQKIKSIVENTLGTKDTKMSRGLGRPELLVNINREKAALAGTNIAQIASVLRTQVFGTEATQYREDGDEFEVYLRANENKRRTIEDINRLVITTATGTTIRLGSIATIEESTSPTEIERQDRERIVKVGADIYKRPLGDIATDIQEQLDNLEIPEGIDVTFGGSVKEQKETFSDLFLLLILSLLLVYMVMASQFESFRDPFIIMFSIPFAFVGVIWAFFITQTTLNLMSFIGLIILVGIVVKNAIVLIDYTNILRKRGLKLIEAVSLGGKHRLRPVLMTALTTILGMLPMATSQNEGSEMWRPLGITVIGGMLVSTLVTLVLIPVIYSIFESRKNHVEGEQS